MGFVIRFTPIYIYLYQVYVAAGAGANKSKGFFRNKTQKKNIIIVGMGD